MIVLDSSFIVKLVVEEEGSGKARELVRSWIMNGEVLATVDTALVEALNALWKHCLKIKDLSLEEAVASVEDLLNIWSKLKIYSSSEVGKQAFELALKEGITIYDALYIQLAILKKAGLASFDEKLVKVAAKHGVATYP